MVWLVTSPHSLVGSPVTSNAAMRSAVSITVVTAGDAASGLQEAIAVRRAVTVEAPSATARVPRSGAPRPAIRSLTGSAWTSPSARSLDYTDLRIADLPACGR